MLDDVPSGVFIGGRWRPASRSRYRAGHRPRAALGPLVDRRALGRITALVPNAAAPFGGIKQSGLELEGGAEGISENLTTRYPLLSH